MMVALQPIDVVYLISPEWDRKVLARTSSKIPGSPPTLQNGINTAAFPLFEEPGESSALLDRSGVCFSAFLSTLNVEGVKGLVKDIITREELDDSALVAAMRDGMNGVMNGVGESLPEPNLGSTATNDIV